MTTRVVADPLPDFSSASFDAKARHLAWVADGTAWVMNTRLPKQAPIRLSPDGEAATHVRLAPDGSFAIYHRVVEARGKSVPTANIVWIE